MRTVHPGATLGAELRARGLSCNAFAAAIKVPANRVSSIVAGKRRVTPDSALRIGRALGTDPAFWVRLQCRHDLALAEASEVAKG